MTNIIRSNFQDHPFHLVSPSPWPAVWFGKSLFWVKLSNSENPLKSFIPSYIWKYVSGWINYSGKVTSKWIFERRIGNCGSKSALLSVKEQRVNGSYTRFFVLKYTLMGFERNYPFRIPSNQINKINNYSTLVSNSKNLNPFFVTGFTDAEGCFSLKISKRSGGRNGWDIVPSFIIVLHNKDKSILEGLKSFFKVGNIFKHGDTNVQYQVNSVADLQILIEHFNNYPLLTKKHIDFLLFKEIVSIFLKKEHLTKEGILKLVALKASLNKGLSDMLKIAFPYVLPVSRPLMPNVPLHEQWLAGFTTGEGCFKIKIAKASTKLGERVQLIFQLTQHIRDEELIRSLIQFLGCGNVNIGTSSIDYRVLKLEDILTKVIPFFFKNPILGIKTKDFQDFKKVAEIMEKGLHLTSEGLNEIKKIKSGTNRGRKLT